MCIRDRIKGPEDDLDGDRHMFGYRTVGIADVYANKLAGIYMHNAADVYKRQLHGGPFVMPQYIYCI